MQPAATDQGCMQCTSQMWTLLQIGLAGLLYQAQASHKRLCREEQPVCLCAHRMLILASGFPEYLLLLSTSCLCWVPYRCSAAEHLQGVQ